MEDAQPTPHSPGAARRGASALRCQQGKPGGRPGTCRSWRRVAVLLCVLLLGSMVAQAQEEPIPLVPGTLVSGQLGDGQPSVAYQMTGTRGAVLHFTLTATSGDLDPVLRLFDAQGQLVLYQDDSQGSRNVDTTFTVQDNGRYTLVVARFGDSLGTSSGDYELSVERVGIQSSEGSTLQYGDSVTATITSAQPQVFYTFQAQAGDILNIEMRRSSGGLDPYVQIVDAQRFLIAENDDADGNTRNARIEGLLIEQSGTYIIVATRYGETVGNFVLTLEEARNSGLGNTAQAPQTILFNETLQGTLDDAQYQRFYQFTGARNQIITITMERGAQAGLLDAYLVLTNAGFQPLQEDDDSGSGRNARIARYRLPADGLYYIIATRFEGEAGTTTGDYQLSLQSEGFAFEGVPETIPRLEYGGSLQDAVTGDDTEALYVFWGSAGDDVRVTMDRMGGNLNPVLELLDAEQIRLVYDDDSGAEQNAQIERYELPYTGLYYIRATRYTGSAAPTDTTGTFRLSLTRLAS